MDEDSLRTELDQVTSELVAAQTEHDRLGKQVADLAAKQAAITGCLQAVSPEWSTASQCEVSSTAESIGSCVEVGSVTAEVLIRNSREPGGPVLNFTHEEWEAFVAGVKAGEFDLA